MPDNLTDIAKDLANVMKRRFTPPEFIPGCKVVSVDDVDQYAANNGWVEAICGQHNQQRCRWRGQYASIAVDDYVDVMYFPDRRLFEVHRQGGSGALSATVGAANITSGTAADGYVLTADGAGAADWEAIAAGNVIGPGSSTDNAIARWDGTAGYTVQNSAVIVTDAGDVSNGGQGIFQRIVDSGYTVTDHFRSGTIPSGYTWQTYSPFVAPTPAYIGSDWIRAGTGTAPFYLAKTISTLASAYSDMSIMPGQNAYIGWRVDDASNTNWSMFQCREYAGEYYFLLDDSDGVSLSYGPFFWQGPVTMRFFTIVSGSTHQHRLYRLNTQISGQSGLMLNTTTYRSWTPARSGLYINPNGGYGYCDWFYDGRS